MTKRMIISDMMLEVTINDGERRIVVHNSTNEKRIELSDDEYIALLKYATKIHKVLDTIANRQIDLPVE